jgi:hypothetical protein
VRGTSLQEIRSAFSFQRLPKKALVSQKELEKQAVGCNRATVRLGNQQI